MLARWECVGNIFAITRYMGLILEQYWLAVMEKTCQRWQFVGKTIKVPALGPQWLPTLHTRK